MVASTCALQGVNIGIDVVAVRSLDDDDLAIFVGHFTSGEWANIRLLDDAEPEQRLRLAALYWAIKEAVLKALGLGLTSPGRQPISIECCHMPTATLTPVQAGEILSAPMRVLQTGPGDEAGSRWLYAGFWCGESEAVVVVVVEAAPFQSSRGDTAEVQFHRQQDVIGF